MIQLQSTSTLIFAIGGSESVDQEDEGYDLFEELLEDTEFSVLFERLADSLVRLLLCKRLLEEELVDIIFRKM